jgi:hypothetical protein
MSALAGIESVRQNCHGVLVKQIQNAARKNIKQKYGDCK